MGKRNQYQLFGDQNELLYFRLRGPTEIGGAPMLPFIF
jgi:hypothetical protein